MNSKQAIALWIKHISSVFSSTSSERARPPVSDHSLVERTFYLLDEPRLARERAASQDIVRAMKRKLEGRVIEKKVRRSGKGGNRMQGSKLMPREAHIYPEPQWCDIGKWRLHGSGVLASPASIVGIYVAIGCLSSRRVRRDVHARRCGFGNLPVFQAEVQTRISSECDVLGMPWRQIESDKPAPRPLRRSLLARHVRPALPALPQINFHSHQMHLRRYRETERVGRGARNHRVTDTEQSDGKASRAASVGDLFGKPKKNERKKEKKGIMYESGHGRAPSRTGSSRDENQ
ncbi:hypothetical protein C8R45DRAFT_931778 [Mycena sanguinolenta]|nr:hypothetical protein C8R45DRAFT_931778 [Mycena sanguinolenta]